MWHRLGVETGSTHPGRRSSLEEKGFSANSSPLSSCTPGGIGHALALEFHRNGQLMPSLMHS